MSLLASRVPRAGRSGGLPGGRAVFGACALAFASGWNISNTGAVATRLAHAYGVGLGTVGLFTTALFTTHLATQIPGGRASDRFGARRTGLCALATIAAGACVSSIAPDAWLGIAARLLTGVGTGTSFMAGFAYLRAMDASPAVQGVFGGVGIASGGASLAIVPQVAHLAGWRAPYASSVALALAALALLAMSPRGRPPAAEGRAAEQGGVLRDRSLYRLAVAFAGSLGLSVVAGNWVVTMLTRHGGLDTGVAGAIGSLTLVTGIVARPFGGWLLHRRPWLARRAVALSLAGGAAGTALIAVARPPAVAVLGAALVGVGAGIPFAPAFTGAAGLRPDSPGAATGFVNGAASAVILAGTPLLGLSFDLPGAGRAGFAAVALLWLVPLLLLPSARQLGAARAPGARGAG